MEQNRVLFKLIRDHKWNEFEKFLKSDEDIDVNIRDESNNYLINYAILFNNKKIVSLLISRGSKLDIVDSDGRSILYLPIRFNYTDILNLLLHFNESHIGVSLVDIKDFNDNIPLHYAISVKNIEFVKLLLDAGSDPNVADKKGNNSLHLAIYSREYDICKIIIDHGIDINKKTHVGETALHISCNLQLVEITELLINSGIDVNSQDYDNEFIPLHYTVNLNNIFLSKLLIENGTNINSQDFFGNTPLHYAIIESNLEILDFILNSEFTKNKVNINIYNIDSKLPIHILFDVLNKDGNTNKDDKIYQKIINRIVVDSKLTFQDKEGLTGTHFVSMNNLWKSIKNILKKKKMNIFIKNKLGDMPIDYISKNDIDEYMEMITYSYLYILRNNNVIWTETWENLCTKELFADKMTKDELSVISKHINIKNKENKDQDICYRIIKNKLNSINRDNVSCADASYPIKKNRACIAVPEYTRYEFCTFTGITLDILSGLIYLLRKYNTACATIDKNFVENKELCKYYESIGIMTQTRCEFLNFEAVWVYQKLHFSEGFIDNFLKCIKNKNIQFIIIPFGIEMREGSHANYLIYDIKAKEIERFEPYGSQHPYKFNYNPKLLDKLLEHKFLKIDEKIKYIAPIKYMPKIGFQFFDSIELGTKKIGDPGGFCALWSIWYTDMRLLYPAIKRDKLIKKLLKIIKSQNISFRDMIRNYSRSIVDIRDDILNKSGININDWLNDNYNEEQLIAIVKSITDIIVSLQKN